MHVEVYHSDESVACQTVTCEAWEQPHPRPPVPSHDYGSLIASSVASYTMFCIVLEEYRPDERMIAQNSARRPTLVGIVVVSSVPALYFLQDVSRNVWID